MTAPELCAVGHAARGRHVDGCDLDTCPGCLPARSAPGLWVCQGHEMATRQALRDLPRLHEALAVPRVGSADSGRSQGRTAPLPLSDDRVQARDAIRLTLHAWTLVLRDDWAVTTPPDTIRSLSHCVAVHAGRLLNSEHAAQLVSDLLGSTDDDGQRIGGVTTTARRLIDTPGRPGIRITCPTCENVVTIDPERDVHACAQCGEWGTVEWWRARLGVDDDQPRPLRDLPDWLFARHGIIVTQRALREWADVGRIIPTNPAEPAPLGPGGRPIRHFDPTTVAVVALNPARRTRQT